MRWLRFSLALSCSMLLGGLFASTSLAATTTVFKDGFESGSLTAWSNSGGSGQKIVTSAAAHTGSYGLNLSGTSAESEKAVETLSVPLTDSTTEFWMRVDSSSGVALVAEGRDAANTGYEWVLKYDSASQQLCFYPYSGATSTELLTGAGSAPMNTWLKVLIVYDATGTGGAKLSINGHSPSAWSVGGNYVRPDGLQRVQLWNNVAGSVDFDDVVVTTPDGTGAGLPVDKSPPTVSGAAAQGQTLTASSGSWGNSPTGYSYSWQDCDSAGNNCAPISGATSSTYVVQASDVGHTIRAIVAARNSVGSVSSTRSPQTTVVTPPPPANTELPVISGTAEQGDTLTATNGSWSGSPISYSYQWLDCDTSGSNCTVIAGATLSSYVLTSGDVGDTIRAVVTASNAGGSGSASSAQSAVVTTAVSIVQPVGDPLGRAWTEVFDDEFNGTSIDKSRWVALNGWGNNNVTSNAKNCSESGGNLILALPGDGTGCDLYSSQKDGAGANAHDLLVGDYLEARIWFPGPGSSPTSTLDNWPAFWAYDGSGNWLAGENDIAEALGHMEFNYHSTGQNSTASPPGNWGNSWHVYGIYRSATQVQVFYDGVLVQTLATSDNGGPESIMFTSGVTDACCGAPAVYGPAGNVLVDWVREWN